MSSLARKLNLTCNPILLERKNAVSIVFKKPLTLNIILLVAIFGILILYIVEINQIIGFGFRLNELEQKSDEIKKTNKVLELEKIKLESLNHAENELSSLNLIKTEKIEYLKPIGGVALTQK